MTNTSLPERPPPMQVETIVAVIASEFASFGGGKSNQFNILSVALQNHPPMFAAGVDIKAVTERIMQLLGYEVVVHVEQ